MTPAARLAAAAAILDDVLAGRPAEPRLTTWSRGARYAGSKDRAAVRDLVYDALRRRRSLAWLGGAETGRGLMLGSLRRVGAEPAALMTGGRHALAPPTQGEAGRSLDAAPRAVQLDVPDWLLPRLEASLGPDVEAVCLALTERAPVFLRANLLRTTPTGARHALALDGIVAEPDPDTATALRVTGGASKFHAARAYADGLVELQDASSQAAVLRLPLRDGDRVLDACAGGGGKALAMGALARLDLSAFDASPARMADLPRRAARAGIAVRVLEEPLARAPYDLVLVDAPCSGSGTWRRTPDAKWRLTPERLEALCALQERLLDAAAGLVDRGGHVAFATCSVLDEEGPRRIEAFLAGHAGWEVVDVFRRHPSDRGDGFHQSLLRRT